MEHNEFQSCKADGKVWIRPSAKDSGEEYFEYLLLYFDDALCFSDNSKHVPENEIGKDFYIRDGSVGPPKLYLDKQVSKVTLANGFRAWSFGSSQYDNSNSDVWILTQISTYII